ncbi:MAG TPA: YihY/virulence factor BrkB family protein [Puia sp.]
MHIKKNSICEVLGDAFRLFRQNDPLRMAAATSFFVSFALPAILFILIVVFGAFGDPRTVRHDIFKQLSVGLDKNIALQVRDIVRNLHKLPLSTGMRIGGFVFLLFVATTLFEIIKNSINQLWKIRLKHEQGIAFVLLNRIRAVGIILMAGVLFSIVLLEDAGGWLLPLQVNTFFYRFAMMLAVAIWFFVILKWLSYGRPHWKIAWIGALFTGLLFTAGQTLLHLLLNYDTMEVVYGTSTALALLLLFVFYCSFIFYFGACFTWSLGQHWGHPIQPSRQAEIVES